MKTQNIIVLSLAVVIAIIGSLIWASPSHAPNNVVVEPAYEEQSMALVGAWRGGGNYEDGSEWYMLYTFNEDGSYELETDSTYGESGTFRIAKLYNDGSVDVAKTYKEGEKNHEMHVALIDENTINVEGATLSRIIVD